MTERWLPIPGWSFYEASDLGRIRSLTRKTPAGTRRGRILKAFPDASGRFNISLSIDGVRKSRHVSVLVALAFLGERPADMVVCHNDGILANNAASNLRYDTQSSNMLDRQVHGTDPQQNKTHCPQGHPYDEENTTHWRKKRQYRICRICHNERTRRQRAALRGQEPKEHGTYYAYSAYKCRCDLCREAAAVTRLKYVGKAA